MSSRELERRADSLSRSSLFGGLQASQLNELAEVGRVRSYDRKEEVFHKGDEGSDTYVVMGGRLKALTTSLEGDDVVFSILGPGDAFGEIAMFAEMPRTASVAALEKCELLSLGRRDLLGFLKRHPQAAISMLGMVSRRLAHVSELVEDTLFLNLPIRLAKKLVSLIEDYGEEVEAGTKINLKLSQTEWGDLVGTTRESINKQIGIWTKQGILSSESGYLVIHQAKELERLADALLY